MCFVDLCQKLDLCLWDVGFHLRPVRWENDKMKLTFLDNPTPSYKVKDGEIAMQQAE